MLHSEELEEVQYTLYPAMFAGSLGGLHDTLILVSSVCSRIRLVGGSFSTVSVPCVSVVESLVQVTVVAGPPAVIHVRVSCEVHLSILVKFAVISDIAISPNGSKPHS